MRRMYSINELTELIRKNLLSGEFDIIGNTISPKHPSKEYEITADILGDRTLNLIYNKAFVSAGLLFIILNFTLKNETESSISASNVSFVFEVDEEVGDKIYCLDGEKLSDDYTTTKQISAFTCVYGQYLNNLATNSISKVAKNKIKIFVPVQTLSAGASEQFTGRQYLSLFE